MASEDFKLTVKTVNRNFQKYTQAMEADIQSLITSILDVIESKIVALRKLLKLKLCIRNVRSFVNLEDFSMNATYTFNERKDGKRDNDSLDDLSSMIYEIDKNSLPFEDNCNEAGGNERKLKLFEDFADIESLCTALNNRTSKLSTLHKEDPNEEPRKALDKYIYLLLDAERQKEKTKETEDMETQKIGDATPQKSNVGVDVIEVHSSEESVVYLGKTEYESILNVLNTILRTYKIQEELAKKSKTIEKAKTEPLIGAKLNQTAGRKILSDSVCQQKDVEKKIKNRKNCCI